MAQRILSRKPCVIYAMSCDCRVMSIIDTAYSPISVSTRGTISPAAALQSVLPALTYFSITAMTFCMKMDGTEFTAADATMHIRLMGSSTG